MPLSRRKRVVLVEPDDALYQLAQESPNTQVYYLEQTGEIFQSYEAYAARMSFYQSKQFQCEVTGKSGLNYFQALDSERQEASTLHSRFSQPLKPAVLKAVQWQVMGRLDHLVEAVFDRFKDRYFKDERILVDLGGTKYFARIDTVYPPRSLAEEASTSTAPSTTPEDEGNAHVIGCDLKIPLKDANTRDDPTKYLYWVRVLEPERSQEKGKSAAAKATVEGEQPSKSLMEVACNVMSRDRLSFSKSILRRFIRDCVDRDAAVASPWTVKPAIAKRFGVDSAMPENIRKGVEDLKKGEIDKRKKIWEAKEGPPTKKQKRMAAAQEEKAKIAAAKKEAAQKEAERQAAEKKKKKPVRYPTEDLETSISEKDKKAGMKVQRPIPNRTLLAFNETPGVFEAFLASWNFLMAHGQPLHLSPFTLDDFEGAIRHNLLEPPCTLLGEVHSTLVYTLRTVPSTKELGIESLQSAPDRPTFGVSCEHLLSVLETTGSNWERVPLRASEGRKGWEEAMIGCLKTHATEQSFPRMRQILTFLLFDCKMPGSVFDDGDDESSSSSDSEKVVSEPVPVKPRKRYPLLPPSDRIAILSFMCNVAVSSKAVHSYMESCEEQLTALRKEKIEINRSKKQFTEEINALVEETKEPEEGENANGDVVMHDGEASDVSASEASSQTGSSRGKQNQRASLRERMREKQAAQKRALAERRRLDEEVNKLEKRLEAIEREFRKLLGAVRIKPLGKDRFYNRIWWFDGLGSLSLVGGGGTVQYGTGRIFIQGPSEFDRDTLENRPEIEERRREEEGEDGILESHEWAVYSEPEEMDEFMAWLNSRGNRELALKTALTKWWPHIAPGIRKRQADLQASTKQPETNRRSSRMKNGAGHDITREPYMLWTNRRAINAT